MKTKLFQVLMRIGSVLGLMIMSGCAGISSENYLENTRNSLAASNHPPAYIEGYIDGCSSGKRSAGDRGFSHRKDTARAARDTLYANGWYEGHIHCRNETIQARQLKDSAHYSPERRSRADQEEMRQMWEQLRK